jgi:hypothetical protein
MSAVTGPSKENEFTPKTAMNYAVCCTKPSVALYRFVVNCIST